MAYLGRQGVTAPLTSADIPDNSITSAKIVDDSVTTVKILDDNVTAAKIPAGAVSSDVLYLENNTSTQTLSGTYSTERLYFNDEYQLTGDVTVTGHLALGSIADEDIVITNDTSGTVRILSGGQVGGVDRTIEGGNVLQDTHRTSLTDMTGTLGSAVTGSPNLNLTTGTLGGGVTFPAGHVLQVKYNSDNLAATAASDNPGYTMLFSINITPVSTSSTFMCFWDIAWNGGVGFGVRLMRDSTVGYQSSYSWLDVQTAGRSRGSWMHLDYPETTSAITYTVRILTEGGGSVSINPNGTKSHLTIMEVA